MSSSGCSGCSRLNTFHCAGERERECTCIELARSHAHVHAHPLTDPHTHTHMHAVTYTYTYIQNHHHSPSFTSNKQTTETNTHTITRRKEEKVRSRRRSTGTHIHLEDHRTHPAVRCQSTPGAPPSSSDPTAPQVPLRRRSHSAGVQTSHTLNPPAMRPDSGVCWTFSGNAESANGATDIRENGEAITLYRERGR
jgi:hypothetical protein